MNFYIWFYRLIGSGFCHQLTERTIHVGGTPLPLCARDTGIYIGVVISIIYIYLRGRFNADKPPQLLPAIILCLMMLPMIFDGITSYLGFRDTNNEVRIFTGMFFGISLAFFIVPLANYKVYEKNSIEVLIYTRELLILAITGIFICFTVVYTDILPWLIISSTMIFGLIFIISRLIYTFVHRYKMINRYTKGVIVFTGTVGLLLLMYLVSNNILRPLSLILKKE